MPEQAAVDMGVWFRRLNAVLGSVVVTVGFWYLWGELPVALAVVFALGVSAFLAWRGTTVARVWAWATLLLGLESLAWPIVTMVRVRMQTGEPTDQQMGDMLTSILFGLFSAIFWMSFSYGIFTRVRKQEAETQAPEASGAHGKENTKHRKKKRQLR